jgi:hypothetical protein
MSMPSKLSMMSECNEEEITIQLGLRGIKKVPKRKRATERAISKSHHEKEIMGEGVLGDEITRRDRRRKKQ